MELFSQILTKGTLNNKYFPHIVYSGCALAIYSFMLMPLEGFIELDLPEIAIANNELFWISWSFIVSGGTLQRSLTKAAKTAISSLSNYK